MSIPAACLVRRRGPAFGFTVAGAVPLASALAAWFALVSRVNPHRAAAPPGSVAAGCEALRVRWESGHPALSFLPS